MLEFMDEGNDKSKKKSDTGTPVLDNFSKDLNKLAQEGKLDPVIGRKKEILRIAQILSRRKKNKNKRKILDKHITAYVNPLLRIVFKFYYFSHNSELIIICRIHC